MGDFNYNGSHAIIFAMRNESDTDYTNEFYHTWTTWHMAPKSRPYVEAPKVKEEYVDVPAADGSLDYTDILTGKPRYANRTGSWEFIIDNGYSQWYEVYSDILMKLHGKKFDRIILEDDMDHYWRGRLSVTGNFSPRDYNSITINYNLEPYKYALDVTAPRWWKWGELFSNLLIYGPFTLNGVKARNLYNDTGDDVKANVNTTYTIRMYPYDGSLTMQDQMLSESFEFHPDIWDNYTLTPGDNIVTLKPGNNFFFFVGNASVTVTYDRGGIL